MERKARYYLAKYLALANAAEFIRSHGEEGHSFSNDKLNDEYLKQKEILADQLDYRANKFNRLYVQTGIDIDTEVDNDI